MRRLSTIALTAALLSVGGMHGLQAQEHHGRGHDDREEVRSPQSKKEQKEVERRIRERERAQTQLTKKEQKALNAQIREQEAARARYRAEQLRLANLERQRELARARAVSNYRYRVGGTSRVTNRLGAQLLQRAVDDGYRQGYQSGHSAVSDRQRFDYRGTNGYRVATYGYSDGYVAPADYQYYFRQGFQRGYDDGYYQRSQFGSVRSNGTATILAAVAAAILGFTVLH